MTWTQARAAAEARSYLGRQGRLATINSAAEQDFIYNDVFVRSAGDHWLGGYQPDGSPEPAGGWRWITDEPFTYTNWRSNEPNNFYGDNPNENRIQILAGDNGTWYDVADSNSGFNGGYIVEYPADSSISGGTSQSLSYPVSAISTIVLNSASTLNLTYAASAPLTATVKDQNGNLVTVGQAQLRELSDNQIIDTRTLDLNGQAKFNVIGLSTGATQYIVNYLPQDPYASSASGPIDVTTSKALPIVNGTVSGKELLVSLALPSGTPSYATAATGSIILSDNNIVNGTLTLYNGAGSFDLSTLAIGLHSLSVSYAGDANYLPAVSQIFKTIVLPPVATQTTLSASVPSSAPGLAITLTASVTALKNNLSVPGVVTFFGNGVSLGSSDLTNGTATLPVTFDALGDEDLYATFQPRSDFTPSSSSHITLPVQPSTTIDLLAVYTHQLLRLLGSPVDILTHLQQLIDQANQAYRNSQIPLTLNLLALDPTNYPESGNLAKDLTRLADPRNRFMGDIPAIRDTLGADLVVLLESQSTEAHHFITFGISTQLANPKSAHRDQSAFIVIDLPDALQYYSLAHEIGHTLGASHAVNDPGPRGAAPYSHGYRYKDGYGTQYHDIMAYQPGLAIPYFSNPNITILGIPIGNAKTADASRVIREQAPIVANYRSPKPTGAIDFTTVAQIEGYVLDPLSSSPLTLRIDIDGQPRATLTATSDRPDLTAKFGIAVHGFTYALPLLPPGKHTITLYALDPITGNPVLIATTALKSP